MYAILTCADTKFYGMACILAKNIRLYSDCQLFLYDLGLTEAEKRHLSELEVVIECIPYDKDTFSFNSKGNIRTTHKIGCIQHFLRKYNSGVIVIDADAFFIDDCIQDMSPKDDEIVVTYRCDREKKPHILINGKINAGVMCFGKNIGDEFFSEWASICLDKEQTDQSALSCLLDREINLESLNSVQPYGKYHVRVLDGNIYNDVTCRVGKIFHFKSAGRKLNKYLGIMIFSFFLNHFPTLVRKMISINRKYGLFVWNEKIDYAK